MQKLHQLLYRAVTEPAEICFRQMRIL